MKIVNKTGKMINLNKSYTAKTRFILDQDGRLVQQTVLYDETGRQKRVIITTPHGELALTRKSAIFKLTFDRRKNKPGDMDLPAFSELEEMFDFFCSGFGQMAIDQVDQGFKLLDEQNAA